MKLVCIGTLNRGSDCEWIVRSGVEKLQGLLVVEVRYISKLELTI